MCVHPWHGWTFVSSIRSDSVACMSISYCSTRNWVPQRPAHPFQRWHVINYFLNILSSAFSSLQITQVLSWENEDSDPLGQSPCCPLFPSKDCPLFLSSLWGSVRAYSAPGTARSIFDTWYRSVLAQCPSPIVPMKTRVWTRVLPRVVPGREPTSRDIHCVEMSFNWAKGGCR